MKLVSIIPGKLVIGGTINGILKHLLYLHGPQREKICLRGLWPTKTQTSLCICTVWARCLPADPGVVSLIPTRSHTFVEIDHEIISTVILLPTTYSRRVVNSYKRQYMHKVLVNRLVKLARHDHSCWLGHKASNRTKISTFPIRLLESII